MAKYPVSQWDRAPEPMRAQNVRENMRAIQDHLWRRETHDRHQVLNRRAANYLRMRHANGMLRAITDANIEHGNFQYREPLNSSRPNAPRNFDNRRRQYESFANLRQRTVPNYRYYHTINIINYFCFYAKTSSAELFIEKCWQKALRYFWKKSKKLTNFLKKRYVLCRKKV